MKKRGDFIIKLALLLLPFNVFADTNTTLWNSTFDLGIQMLSNYDENGENQGLNKSRMFANINLDARWKKDMNNSGSVTNVGIDLKLLGTAIYDTNKTIANSFNDVSDTLDVSVYFQYVPDLPFFLMGVNRGILSEIGFITHAGIRSRKEKSNNNDTVDIYGDIGLKYSFFREDSYSENNGIAKKLPDFYIGTYYRVYSDYNGFAHSRVIVDFKYQIVPEYNFFIGAEANLGDKDDEFYLTFTVRNKIKKLFDFFRITQP